MVPSALIVRSLRESGAAPKNVPVAKTAVSDAALVKSLPGSKNRYADVNGIRLHYVIGGKGQPLVLLPGWPETYPRADVAASVTMPIRYGSITIGSWRAPDPNRSI